MIYYILLGFFLIFPNWVYCQSYSLEIEKEKLLSRLNLALISKDIPSQKSEINTLSTSELLTYFKNRDNVLHPAGLGKGSTKISERDAKWAKDALGHIFVGQPALPSFFCGEDINWDLSPVSDMEWKWQLHRMYFWNAMAKVYASSRDESYAKAWCHQLVDWVKKNPHDIDHKQAWRSIEAGIRGRSWTTLFYRFLDSEHFDEEVLITFLNSCYDHAEYLMKTYSSGSNWALMEAEGLAFIAFTFPEFKNSSKWKKEAIRRFNIEIDHQINADGYQQELSMSYHVGSINWFFRSYELAELNEQESIFPSSFVQKIERMCEIPMEVCLPDGTNPQFGDDWAGKPYQYHTKFKTWAKRFKRDDFLFIGSKGAEGFPPKETAFKLDSSGIYSMRSAWDNEAICFVMKCGPDGGMHCQPDNGTFTLYAGGKTLMPDAGSYVYSGDPEGRNWFRQSKVHQTLTLDEQNIAYKPKLLEWKTSDSLVLLTVENQSYSELKHRRSVFFIDKKYFVIVDDAIGNAEGVVDLNFQFAPGEAMLDFDNLEACSTNKGEWNVAVRTISSASVTLKEEEGWVSFEYGKKEQRPAFKFRVDKRSEKSIRYVSIIIPYKDEIPDYDIEFDFDKKEDISFQMLLEGKVKSYRSDVK